MALIKRAGTTKSIGLATQEPASSVRGAPVMQPGVLLQDRYLIEGTLGIGGMSVVYRGRDMRFRDVIRQCAIKEMTQSTPDSNTRLLNLKNFERESGLLATLQHPAIPKVYDFFEENGRIYLILEQIPGNDLETVLDQAGGPLAEARVALWAVQLCDVLSYLHSQAPDAIVFRDLKPSNIMVAPDERIVLIDFGIARDLVRGDRKGTMIGTEGYSPPEQYRGSAEPRSDIYALGATLHHLLTANDPRLETPFTFHERPIRKLNSAISPDMEAIVMRALSYDANERWESAAAMRHALQALPALAQQSNGVAPMRPAPPSARPGAAPAAPAKQASGTAELVWRFKAEDELRSSPVVSHGQVFIGCYDTNLYAVDLATGQFRWKYPTNGGIASSPAVWTDVVITGSEDGNLYAIDARRGTARWQVATGKPIRSSPRVEDRFVFIGSDDFHLYAIDAMRGSVVWKYRSWMPIRSSACMADGSVFVGGDDGHIYCLDIRNGGIRWKQKTQQPIRSTPAYADNTVFVGSMDQNLYALDAEGGFPIWKVRTNHYVNSSPCVSSGRVYVGGIDGIIYAVEIKNGRIAWRYETGSQVTSSPRVVNGRLYIGGTDGFVYCLDAGTGNLIWRYQTAAPVVSSPAVADGVVYIGSMDYTLYALRA